MTTELPTAGTPIYVDADADALSYLFQYQTESAVLRLIEDRPPLWRFILFAVELTNGLRAVENEAREDVLVAGLGFFVGREVFTTR